MAVAIEREYCHRGRGSAWDDTKHNNDHDDDDDGNGYSTDSDSGYDDDDDDVDDGNDNDNDTNDDGDYDYGRAAIARDAVCRPFRYPIDTALRWRIGGRVPCEIRRCYSEKIINYTF